MCKWKANFSQETKTLLIYWILPFCSITFCHISNNFVISRSNKFSSVSTKNDSISSSIVKFSKPILTPVVIHQITFYEPAQFFPFLSQYGKKYDENVPFQFSILKSTPDKQLLTRSCIFFFWNKLEQSGVRLHSEFAV